MVRRRCLPELEQSRNTRRIPSRRVPCTSFAGCGSHRHLPYFLSPSLLQEGFGQSFLADFPPPNYQPDTPVHYWFPETFFESKISFASDVWALACTIFEIRAGFQLFDPFLASDTLILQQIVGTLDRFPDLWWSPWEAREQWFDEAGKVKPETELIAERAHFVKNCATSGNRMILTRLMKGA